MGGLSDAVTDAISLAVDKIFGPAPATFDDKETRATLVELTKINFGLLLGVAVDALTVGGPPVGGVLKVVGLAYVAFCEVIRNNSLLNSLCKGCKSIYLPPSLAP